VRTIVEVPPKRDAAASIPPGHACWHQECVACHRDFRVFVPVDSGSVGGLTLDVPCPHCHRHRVEVLIGVSGPILVEPVDRTWLEWRVRRGTQVIEVARRTIVVRAGQLGRMVKSLGHTDVPADPPRASDDKRGDKHQGQA
jgi:hypothetical protein